MVKCSVCDHENPDGAVTCEACFAPLPTLQRCPQCGAPVMSDANFCGQCGYNLQTRPPIVAATVPAIDPPGQDWGVVESVMAADLASPPTPAVAVAQLWQPDPLIAPEPAPKTTSEHPQPAPEISEPPTNLVVASPPPALANAASAALVASGPITQMQRATARLVHISTNVVITLPERLNPIHIGKPNDLVPPDLDLSGLPNAEVVSRIHADIRVEGDAYYLEDVGSANGTYVNGLLLVSGNRHRLRPGDRLAFGKHDLVSFWFQLGV